MAYVHILSGSNGVYNFVVHVPTPEGVNSANVSWANALVGSGMAKTSIESVGTGPGQITAEEKAAIEAGTVIEARGVYQDQGYQGQELSDDFSLRAQQTTNDRMVRLADQLKWYGLTIA